MNFAQDDGNRVLLNRFILSYSFQDFKGCKDCVIFAQIVQLEYQKCRRNLEQREKI